MQEATTTTDTREKLARVERELGAEVLEREEVVRSMILALIAGEHVLLLGPPGTAKSRLARSLCERISGASYFYACLNRSSLPDEVFGPLMLSALREDRFERNTQGMLPEAEVAFVDEVFKSNSAVLNGMLPILNERVYKNGASATPVPLQMAVCASNEMPEDREELSALYDRLLARHLVLPIRDESSFEAVLLGRTRYASPPGTPPAAPRTTITLSEIARAREEASEVDLSGVVSQVSEIRRELSEKGIEPSVRRFDRGCYLVRASAYPERARAAARWCMRASKRGLEAYFCAHLLLARRRIKANAAPVLALWADADDYPLPAGSPEPTAIVESSPGRAHLFWRLTTSVTPYRAEELNRRLLISVGADRSGWDLSQLLRPPGTRNRKYASAPAVRLLGLDAGARYHPHELEPALPEAFEPATREASSVRALPEPPPSPTDLSRLSFRARALIAHGNAGAGSPYRSRSEADFAVCLAMFGAGYEEAEIRAVMTDPANGISEKTLEKGRHAERYLVLTIGKARTIAGVRRSA